jgi:hypothetical protein
MNAALTMEEAGQALRNVNLEGPLAFLASRSRKSAQQLSPPASEVFNGIGESADQLLLDVIETRTEAEFRQTFEASFPKYVLVTLALSRFAHAMVPPDVINRLDREGICELEADFREKALSAFGASVRDQLLFTIFTLRKISDLLIQISATKPDSSEQKNDEEYGKHFTLNALRASFSLDCLRLALRLNRPIYPEVMESLQDGLRSIVNAYAWARRGAAIRVPAAEPTLEFGSSSEDEEDEELLCSSMQDMAQLLDAEEPQ